MAYTQNESIDWLTAITPTTDDIVVTMDQAEIGVAKTSTLLSIYNLFKTTYDTVYAKYLGDADFYKYQITTSVAGGNLTVTLLNYLGATPSATAPVKIQNQDWTIRTITSSCSATIASNDYYHFNAGSTELATKEIDYCVYIGKFGWPLISRLYHYRLLSDGNLWWESAISNTGWFSGTDTFVPIWRFNAIKASWTSGNWSIPATSVIINSPIYDTRWLDWLPTFSAWTAFTNQPAVFNNGAKYKIEWDKILLKCRMRYNATSWGTGIVGATTPFSALTQYQSWFWTALSTGKWLATQIGWTLNLLQWYLYDGTTPIGNNNIDEPCIIYPI